MATLAPPSLEEREAHEFIADFSAGAINTEAGTIAGIKVLGPKSSNGREYTRAAMEAGAPLYEGAPVYVDHNMKPKDGRSYRDRFGALSNVRYEQGGIYADLRFNPKHAVAEQFVWDVQNQTPRVGFSHTVLNRVRVSKGIEIVEQIAKVISVDLVSNPATTSTVFEQAQEPQVMADETQEVQTLNEATLEQVKRDRPRLYDEIGSRWAEENVQRLEVEADQNLRARLETLVKENDELRTEISEARGAQESIQRRIEVDHRILQQGIPRDLDTKLFREQLYEAADKHGFDRVEALIQDRKSALGRYRTVSREQGATFPFHPVIDGESFAKSVQR